MSLPATLADWRRSPQSRWSFRNVDKLLPTARIAAAGDGGVAWTTTPASFDAFRVTARDRSSLTFDEFLVRTATDAMVVVHRGAIVHESYDHGTAAETRHIVMSATKSVVGLLAGILHGAGRLDLEAPVARLVPEVARSAFGDATIRQLLDMRTGVVFDRALAKAYSAAAGWDPTPDDAPASGLHAFFAGLPPASATHDGPFAYVSANTDLLGWAMERAAGQPFATLASDLLWKPMGAAHDAAITTDVQGAARCTGGLCATARDLARVGQLMLDGGTRGGREVVPAAWLADIADNGDPQAWARGEFAAGFGGQEMHYRSGWYVIDREPQVLFAMGVHGQTLFVDRANGIVIAKLSSQDLPIDPEATRLTLSAVTQIRRCLQ